MNYEDKDKDKFLRKFIKDHHSFVLEYHRSNYNQFNVTIGWKEQLRKMFTNALNSGGIGNISQKATSIEDFEKKVNKMQDPTYDEFKRAFNATSYDDLFKNLKCKQMASKKAALFLRDIIYLGYIIRGVPGEEIKACYVPVDRVIVRTMNAIYNANYEAGEDSFQKINERARLGIFSDEPILLEDLWFWGRFYRCPEKRIKKDKKTKISDEVPVCEFNRDLLTVENNISKKYRDNLLEFVKENEKCPFKTICSLVGSTTAKPDNND